MCYTFAKDKKMSLRVDTVPLLTERKHCPGCHLLVHLLSRGATKSDQQEHGDMLISTLSIYVFWTENKVRYLHMDQRMSP